ncbi:MAG: enoyl-CoA hydratase-related protein, partial [Chloroflexota bacterium]
MADKQFVKVTVEDRIAIITIDHAPVNALNNEVLDELSETVDEVVADTNVKAAIITGGGQMAFVAGADINEFTKLNTPEQAKGFIGKGQSTFNKIENSPKPFIAAINGVALGGGMELAMACHIRIASDMAKFG